MRKQVHRLSTLFDTQLFTEKYHNRELLVVYSSKSSIRSNFPIAHGRRGLGIRVSYNEIFSLCLGDNYQNEYCAGKANDGEYPHAAVQLNGHQKYREDLQGDESAGCNQC